MWHHAAGIVSCGDCAGLVDPFSGEGITAALVSGDLAGNAVARDLVENRNPARLKEYSSRVREPLLAAISPDRPPALMGVSMRVIASVARGPLPPQAPSALSSVEPLLRSCRRNLLAGLADAPMSGVLLRYFERGKMLRAGLVFLSTAAVGGSAADAMQAAIAIELLHGASLVHDDIIDEAAERRGLPALHRQVGEGVALALGDYLMLRAFSVLTEAPCSLPHDRVVQALRTLSRWGQECCRGEISELGGFGAIDSEEAYCAMVRGKTGSLFAAAATVGAVMGGAKQGELDALCAFGLSAGTVFQIYDDVLELVGEPGSVGKSVAVGAQARPLFPLICLEGHGSPEARAECHHLRRDEGAPLGMALLLAREGVLDRVIKTQESHMVTAVRALADLHVSEHTQALKVLVEQCHCRPLLETRRVVEGKRTLGL